MISVFKPASCSYQTWICASHRLNLGIGRPLISSSITWEALASQPAGRWSLDAHKYSTATACTMHISPLSSSSLLAVWWCRRLFAGFGWINWDSGAETPSREAPRISGAQLPNPTLSTLSPTCTVQQSFLFFVLFSFCLRFHFLLLIGFPACMKSLFCPNFSFLVFFFFFKIWI